MPIEYAPNFSKRLTRQSEISNRQELWGWSAGIYIEPRHDIIPGVHPVRYFWDKEGRSRSLEGYEVFMLDVIGAQLQKQTDKPTVVFDIGGGGGASMGRLAHALKKEVEASKVAFVISNLNKSADQQLYTHMALHNPLGNKPEEKKVLQQFANELDQTRSLMHSQYGSPQELLDQSITLPNGITVTMQGNVDFLNEMRSVSANTLVPELEIPAMEQLLSPRAIYVVDAHNFEQVPGEHLLNAERAMGIGKAYKFIEGERGLVTIPHAETGLRSGTSFGNYTIFKRPGAPPVPLY